ncbi:type VI secretion system protein TssA [Shewanella sp. VB17]|uniref:type VI secretion system protein TssA n=1 Tax=Shewanella sp. VB17 TaxID=2739432 RepID=UPI0015652746|nr:type VI secretion system protein TssA [Shewanella sp. VB17]NRD73748.1 type VI secretion system protein TssA [Shewanella sp. VB17]
MTHEYLKKITAPIAGESPVGERLHDDPLFDFVESQLMKVGSLSHAEVQWGEVETAIVTLLGTRSKDLKLITYLMQCVQYQASIERFSLSLGILDAFMQSFWETCFPAPGARGVLPRRKYFSQIMQRSIKVGESVDTQFCDPDSQSLLLSRLASLFETADKLELPTDDLAQLQTRLTRQFDRNEQSAPAVSHGSVQGSSGEVAQHSPPTSAPKLEIDSTNDKATKQTLLKVADFISEFETGIGLSLRIRRFATWFAISGVPVNANAAGETSLMPIATDRINEYKTQLERGADMALLRRIEQSLTLSPFWLDGHYLSAQIASALGQLEWAKAIHEDTAAFVVRLPKLLMMSFKGGMAFANAETRSWLDEGYGGNSFDCNGQGVEQQRAEVTELAESGGLSVAFASLNEHLQQASEPRDAFYLRLLGADLKQNHQLSAMASVDYQVLYEQANQTVLADWEPTLMARLKQKANFD